MTLFANGFLKRIRCSSTTSTLVIGLVAWISSNSLAASSLELPTNGWYLDKNLGAAFIDYRDGISIYVTF